MWMHIGWAAILVGCIPSRGTATSAKTAPTKSALICVASAMTEACTSLDASISSTPQVLQSSSLVSTLSFAVRMLAIAARQATLQGVPLPCMSSVVVHLCLPTLHSACACIYDEPITKACFPLSK